MAKIYNLPTPKRKEIYTYLFLSDLHSLYIDKEALKVTLKYFSQVPAKQRRIILGGDILDIPFIFKASTTFKSYLKDHAWDDYFIPEIEKEILWFDDFYSKISKLTKKIWFLEGNHEARLRREYFIDEVPYDLRHNFDLKRVIRADSRKIKVFDYNDYAVIKASKMPDLYVTHGTFCGLNPVAKHIKTVGIGGVLFGHTHTLEVKSVHSINGTIIGYNNPCMCATNPQYLEGRINNWSVGFSLINQTRDFWYCNPMLIHEGKIVTPTGNLLEF